MISLFGNPYKMVVFDLDGTLIDSLPVWLDLYKSLFVKRGLYPTDEDIIEIAFYHNQLIDKLGVTDIPEFWSEVKQISSKRSPEAPLFQDAMSTIQRIRATGTKICIYTGSTSHTVANVLDKQGLKNIVDVVVTCDDAKRKPDPEGLYLAAARSGVDPSQMVFVGDSTVDYQTAQNANVDFILFCPPQNKRFIIDSDRIILHSDTIKRFETYDSLSYS